jgi:hypothetical protein
VQAGVRYSDDHQTYAQDYSGALIGPVPLVQEGTEDGTQTTWLLSASYKPSDDSLIYGRVATGYRPGGPNAVPPPNIFPAPTTFEPDELTSYEIGYKGVFADGRVSFEGALFTTDWQDIQIQTSAGGFNFFVNGGEGHEQGRRGTLLWYPDRRAQPARHVLLHRRAAHRGRAARRRQGRRRAAVRAQAHRLARRDLPVAGVRRLEREHRRLAQLHRRAPVELQPEGARRRARLHHR